MSSNKTSGSFWIPNKAIEKLIKLEVSASLICTYLILAQSTDATGQFSPAASTKVSKCLGISRKRAQGLLDKLADIDTAYGKQGLVYKPDVWAKRFKREVPERPSKISEVRWVLNTYDEAPEDAVWIGNGLVEGYGRFKQPLKALKQCGDIAARTLLLLYQLDDMEDYGGIPAYKAVYKYYDMNQTGRFKDFDWWQGEFRSTTIQAALGHKLFPRSDYLNLSSKQRGKPLKLFWPGIEALQSRGFIREIVSVLDGSPNNKDSQPIYYLHTRTNNGYTPKGEEGVGGHIARIMSDHGHPLTDSEGRFYDKFGAIVPAGTPAEIVGIFRLRFRVSNPKNAGVKDAWARIHERQHEAKVWLESIERKGLIIPNAQNQNDGPPKEDVADSRPPTPLTNEESQQIEIDHLESKVNQLRIRLKDLEEWTSPYEECLRAIREAEEELGQLQQPARPFESTPF